MRRSMVEHRALAWAAILMASALLWGAAPGPAMADEAVENAVLECLARDPVKDFDGVERFCTIAIDKGRRGGADKAALHLKRGDARSRSRRTAAKGIADLDRAVALDPTLADAFHFRGLAKHVLRRPEAALEDYNRALKLAPSHAAALADRGLARRGLGDVEGAIADYDAALALNQDDDSVLNNRALAKAKLGDAAGALLDLEAAFREGPSSRIRRYQRALASRAGYEGPVDGVYTAAMRAALIRCLAEKCL